MRPGTWSAARPEARQAPGTWFTVALLILAGVLLAQAVELAPLSRVAPLWVLVPTAAMTGVQLVRDARRAGDPASRSAADASDRRTRQVRMVVWISAVAALVYLLGFVPAAWLYLLLHLRLESSLRWWRSVVVSTLTALVLYLVFVVLAGMRFPVGALLL